MKVTKQIINLRHTYKGLHCDIAVDFPHELHFYTPQSINADEVPIEVACFDRQEWGIEVNIIKIGTPKLYGRIVPCDECIAFCEEWVDRKLVETQNEQTTKEGEES